MKFLANLFEKKKKYLVIKRLGAGFWADVDHVITQLAAAEILGRIPIVEWGPNGPYGDGESEGFTLYFEPVSSERLADLRGAIFPKIWTVDNRFDDLPFPATGYVDPDYKNYFLSVEKKDVAPSDRTIASFMTRREPIIINMCHEPLAAIESAAPDRSRSTWRADDEIRRMMVREHLRLKPHLKNEVDKLFTEHFSSLDVLALHLRGSDKVVENKSLHTQNERGIQIAKDWLCHAGRGLFVLTDSEHYAERVRIEFGDKAVMQDCFRSGSDVVPNYLHQGRNGFQNGRESKRQADPIWRSSLAVGYR